MKTLAPNINRLANIAPQGVPAQVVDRRPDVAAQAKLQALAAASPQAEQLKVLQAKADAAAARLKTVAPQSTNTLTTQLEGDGEDLEYFGVPIAYLLGVLTFVLLILRMSEKRQLRNELASDAEVQRIVGAARRQAPDASTSALAHTVADDVQDQITGVDSLPSSSTGTEARPDPAAISHASLPSASSSSSSSSTSSSSSSSSSASAQPSLRIFDENGKQITKYRWDNLTPGLASRLNENIENGGWTADRASTARIYEFLSAPSKKRDKYDNGEEDGGAPSAAAIHKKEAIKQYLKLVPHMRGEGAGAGVTLIGGHLLTAMKGKYKALRISGTPDNNNAWEGWWSDGAAAAKWSTFFPASWTEQDLVDRLLASHATANGRDLGGGIVIALVGGTFYPVGFPQPSTAGPAISSMRAP